MIHKRIYAVVALSVDTPVGTVVQVPGRMAAQAVHAVSRMKMHRLLDAKTRGATTKKLRQIANEGITTIVLACRDTRELRHIAFLLSKARIKHHWFEDVNPEVYGSGAWQTALATGPVHRGTVEGILDYLPLFAAV
jgi:peptidyl-tRNA hydrolase